MIKAYFKDIWNDRYVLFSLVNKDLNIKYKKSILGVAWSILNPLGMVIIIGSVYSIIFGMDPKLFIPNLFISLNAWIFINTSSDAGALSFISAEGYIKQTNVNSQIFPLRVVCVAFVNFLYTILAFFSIFLFLEPDAFSYKMLVTFFSLFIVFLFTISIANISAILNLKFRDYQQLQGLIFQALFYVTPIIFDPKVLSDKGFEFIYKLNPFYYMIEIIRKPMMGKTLEFNMYLISTVITFITLFISILFIMKNKENIPFDL